MRARAVRMVLEHQGSYETQSAAVAAIAGAVGELGVALPLAGKVGIGLDHMADIDDDQEGRPAIGARHGAGITVGLIAGAQHGVIPASAAALAVALPLFRGVSFQGNGQQGKLVVIAVSAVDALLGLHDERPASVQVDKAARLGAGVDEGDRAFKTVRSDNGAYY